MHQKLGIDAGGVILDRVGQNGRMIEAFEGDDYLTVPPVDGAFGSIERLISERFGVHTYIVSSVSTNITQQKTRHWLEHHGFYLHTGMPMGNVRIVYGREKKAQVCQELGITHFIDDRPQVLETLVGIVPNLYWFKPREHDLAEFPNIRLPIVTLCYSWQHVVDTILADFNDFHEGDFTTEIVGKSPYGIVCRNESLVSAAVRAYQFAFNTTLDDEGKLYFPERCRIADYSRELNVLRIQIIE